jgi:hypothetical protein
MPEPFSFVCQMFRHYSISSVSKSSPKVFITENSSLIVRE